jgi:hypothetical protein
MALVLRNFSFAGASLIFGSLMIPNVHDGWTKTLWKEEFLHFSQWVAWIYEGF